MEKSSGVALPGVYQRREGRQQRLAREEAIKRFDGPGLMTGRLDGAGRRGGKVRNVRSRCR